MGHELAGKLCGDEVDMVFAEAEAGADPVQEFLDVAICREIPFGRGKKHLESPVLETEDDNGEHGHHCKDTEQHSAQHFKMLSEGHCVGILFLLLVCHDMRNFKKAKVGKKSP